MRSYSGYTILINMFTRSIVMHASDRLDQTLFDLVGTLFYVYTCEFSKVLWATLGMYLCIITQDSIT